MRCAAWADDSSEGRCHARLRRGCQKYKLPPWDVQDGRDVPDGTSVKFVEQLEKDLEALEGCDAKIASGGGRMYVTMDRYEVTGACLRISLPVLPPVRADCMTKSALGRVSQPMQGTCNVSALGSASNKLWGYSPQWQFQS